MRMPLAECHRDERAPPETTKGSAILYGTWPACFLVSDHHYNIQGRAHGARWGVAA